MMNSTSTRVVAIVLPIAAALAIFALPLPLDPAGRRALAIATWMVASWLLEPIHPAIVGFAGCFLFVAARCASFDVAFGGFGSATPWFLYGALMLIVSAQSSGAIGLVETRVPDVLARSFVAAASVLVIVSLLVGFLVDAALARAAIAVTLALAVGGAMARRHGLKATMPLVTVASYAAAVLGREGAAHAPSMAWRLTTVAICIAVAARFVRAVQRTDGVADDAVRSGGEDHRSEAARRVLALLAITIVSWLTTRWHGVSPAIVGLGAGIAAAFPGLRPGAKAAAADPIALMLAGAALSVPLVLEETHAAEAIGATLPAWMGSYGQHLLGGLFDPRPEHPSVKLALYQSPALILGAAIAGFTTRDVLKFGAALAIAGAILAALS